MPSSAQIVPYKSSIARILLSTVMLVSSNALLASESQILPPLGNTPATDRILTREVGDDFIYGGPEASAGYTEIKTPAEKATSEPTQATVEQAADDAEASLQATADADQRSAASRNNIEWETEEAGAAWPQAFAETINPNESVWDRIARSRRLPLMKNDRVDFYTQQYLREGLWISKILHRGKPFLAHLVAALDKRFLPVELALLPAIESGFQPTARSAGGASGLWQIVPITAKEIGVERGVWFDGRGDILASTTAAIDYLSYLNAEFNGDWELTLAAYNAGPGRVRTAIRKNKEAGLKTDYWSLQLPQETMNYVPKLIALVALVKDEDRGGFDMPKIAMQPAFESIDIGFRVSLDKVAKLTDIDNTLLHTLNAGLIHGVTAPDGPHHLIIPVGTGDKFQTAFANVDRQTLFSEPKTHEVVAGDTISSVALKYGISQKQLLRMNGLDSSAIRIGQKLAVLDSRNLPDSVIEYVVSIGDTLSEIAHKFSVNMRDITQTDGQPLDKELIHPGDTLNIRVNADQTG